MNVASNDCLADNAMFWDEQPAEFIMGPGYTPFSNLLPANDKKSYVNASTPPTYHCGPRTCVADVYWSYGTIYDMYP